MADTDTLAWLPTAPAPEGTMARYDATQAQGRGLARILVIDDNAIVLESFRKSLMNRGAASTHALGTLGASLFGTKAGSALPVRDLRPAFDVDLVPDGAQGCRCALDAVSDGRPYAVAFVDMRMPGGWDGLQTVEALWHADPGIQVVICTAHSDHSWEDIAARLGRSDRLLILRKPFEAIEVLQIACALSQKWHLECLQEAQLTELEQKVEARVAELRRANRTLLMLSQCNEALVRAGSEAELLQSICRHIVQIGGYRLAWVGYARHDDARSVEPAAHAGTDRDHVDNLHLTWGDAERRRGVGGAAIREGRPRVARRISADPAFAAWRDDALARGFASCIALPLRNKNEAFGTLSIYSEEADAFDAEETKLLEELANDLAYGIVSLREIEQRKLFELELERQANFDPLTGLANRFTLEARLTQSMADARRHANKLALMFVDLDRFKMVNDSLGHVVGDQLLIEVAGLLSSAVRESDTVARLAGDEFVILFKDLDTAADAAAAAGKIIAMLSAPLRVGSHELRPLASIGICVFPDDGDDTTALIRNADTAMYQAKSLGGSSFRFFAPEMNARMASRFALEADLRRALERGELLVHYQPQVALASGVITGAEALVRWRHPDRGMVFPAEFIPLAEETGLIHPLGDWVVANVCAQLRAWLDNGLDVPPVAVNLSARQFRREDLVGTIERALAANRLEAKLLELEITESAVMHDVEAAIATVRRLKALGVRITLDDFGTGYSSLNYLKRFPIDRLKIDRSFVRDVTTDPDDAAICNAVIGLAHNLKLTVIAEGVETEAQLSHLRRRHCDEMQGYIFSRPLPGDEFAQLLASDRKLALPQTDETRRTLLIVDDEEHIVAALKRLLRRAGYHIVTAHSAAEGLQRLTEAEVDVIVSDQRMPGITGVEFLRRAKELYPDTVRIVLSGYTELQSITDAVNEGAIYKFLTKPWDDERLRAHIEEAFRQKEMADENRRLGREVQRANQELAEVNHSLQRLLATQREQTSLEEGRATSVREVLENVPASIIGFDAEGVIAFLNRDAEALLPAAGSLLGRDADEALPPELREAWRGDDGACRNVDLAGRRFRAVCRSLNGTQCSRGKLLVITPEEAQKPVSGKGT